MKRPKRKKFTGRPVRTISDGWMASPVYGGGRPIPIIVLDKTEHQKIQHVIDRSISAPPGDVMTLWGSSIKPKWVMILNVTFIRPVSHEFFLAFDLPKKGIVVDTIMDAEAFVLQLGQPGQTVLETHGQPQMLVEVPNTYGMKNWDKLFCESVEYDLKRNAGLRTKEARDAAPKIIENMRSFQKIRFIPE